MLKLIDHPHSTSTGAKTVTAPDNTPGSRFARRDALKMLSATVAITATSLATSVHALAIDSSGELAIDNPEMDDQEISDQAIDDQAITDVVFTVENAGSTPDASADATAGPILTISNRSKNATTLRHIYPGVVHAEGRTFDLNMALPKRPLTIAAGSKITLPLKTLNGSVEEKRIPAGLTFSKPVTVSTQLLTASNTGNAKIRTLRTCFS